MPNWFDIRIKTEGTSFDAIRTIIRAWPDTVFDDTYAPALEKIAESGVEFMRFVILDSATETGIARAGAGGNGPGRVDTGTMFDSVTSKINANKGHFAALVGWLNGTPGYAIFQELGTSHGIEGMGALIQAREYMLSQIQALGNTGKTSSTGSLGD